MRIATIARIWTIAAVSTAVLAGPAHAQQNSKDPLELKYEAERADQARVEREYNAMMRRTQRGTASEGKVDPWAKVRPAENQKEKR